MTTPIHFDSQEAFEAAVVAYVKKNLNVKGEYTPTYTSDDGVESRGWFELEVKLNDKLVFANCYD